jgi:hypothetical protein
VAVTTHPSAKKDWYKVSVETLRGWAIFLTLAALAVVGYFGYRVLERQYLEREARAVLEDARDLFQQVQQEETLSSFRKEYDAAWQSFEEARSSFAAGDFSGALTEGQRSRALLASILDAVRHRGAQGEAQFIGIQGPVEYRRGERGEWEEARSRLVLYSGDYVKTSGNGSAEIMFVDGTLYTVRPDTLFLVTRARGSQGASGDQAIAMEYGWVNLNTSGQGSRVTTPGAEAVVARDSEAVVAYDQARREGRFAAYSGGLEVTSKGGLTRQVGALEEVVQTGDLLSQPQPLPPAPALATPDDNAELDLEETPELRLGWGAVPRAERYALQVADSRLFVDALIDVGNRKHTAARLGLQGEGTFFWRVAAISGQGLQGPWSEAFKFRVSSPRDGGGAGSGGDHTPPDLALEDVKSYGTIVIIGGHTEPGAAVTINGELVKVEASGAFTKTLQLGEEGWSFVEIRAQDAWGNETVRRHRVFVEAI